MYLSVIIPVYNEEKRLGKTVLSVAEYLGKQSYESEIVIVNDGSTDNTVGLVQKLIGKYSLIKLINNPINHGKGFAVKAGMLAVRGDKRLFMDADGSTPVSEVEKLLQYSHKFDVVIGSRRVDGADIKTDQSAFRLALGWVFRTIVETILPLDVVDSQNGFKLFNGNVANDIFGRQKISGWAFDVEILSLARKSGYKIKEVPISWTNDKESKVTLKGMVKMLWEVVKIRIGA